MKIALITIIERSKVAAKCSNIDCKRGYDPICGSDGKTYANPCIFKYMSCKDPSIQQVKKGRCVHRKFNITNLFMNN